MVFFGIFEVIILLTALFADEYDELLAELLAERLRRLNGLPPLVAAPVTPPEFQYYSSDDEEEVARVNTLEVRPYSSDADDGLADLRNDEYDTDTSESDADDLILTAVFPRLENLGLEGVLNFRIG